jgi:hypothetical protein
MRGAKKSAAAFLGSAIMVTSAWAGASLVPAGNETPAVPQAAPAAAAQVAQSVTAKATPKTPAAPAESAPQAAAQPSGASFDPASLPDGQVLAGAAKTSIEPQPAKYGGTWEKDATKCATLSESEFENIAGDPPGEADHLASTGSPWPENPNCIYMGGFGIGPMNPVSSWDQELGLWVRAMALKDKQGDDLVMAIIDGEGYFWDYNKKCDDCGIKQLTEQLAADKSLDLKPENIIIGATHAHSSPDFIGGWGFVPDWYMKQVSETIKSTIEDAIASERPARLEYGEEMARPFNHERRDTYRAAEEQQVAWMRAYDPNGNSHTGDTIFTMGAYAAHPTTMGTNGGKAHPDWPGRFEKGLEDRFGGIGLLFMTGLGNMSSSGGLNGNTDKLSPLIPALGKGHEVANPDIKTNRTTWQQPVTNVPLTALGEPGFFDHQFSQTPATVQTGEDPDKFQCVSSSPVSAEVATSTARIGEIALTASPGEVFSNFTNSVKENSGAAVTFPLAQTNDALGYMPQSFEMNQVGQQGLGFTDASGYVFVNYEDSYAIDKCFGDMALETAISQLNALKEQWVKRPPPAGTPGAASPRSW